MSLDSRLGMIADNLHIDHTPVMIMYGVMLRSLCNPLRLQIYLGRESHIKVMAYRLTERHYETKVSHG